MDFHDPNLVFYADLAKHDGAAFMSDDAYGHLCTVTGALWRPNGRLFDGDNNVITLPTASSLDPVTNGSVGLWVKANTITRSDTNVTGDNLYCIGNIYLNVFFGATNNAIRVFRYDGTLYYHSGNTAVTTDTWYFVVVTWGTAGIIIYLDGASDGGDGVAGTHTGTGMNHYVGTHLGGSTAVDGLIGEAWLYNRALSAGEILHNYTCTKWRYK